MKFSPNFNFICLQIDKQVLAKSVPKNNTSWRARINSSIQNSNNPSFTPGKYPHRANNEVSLLDSQSQKKLNTPPSNQKANVMKPIESKPIPKLRNSNILATKTEITHAKIEPEEDPSIVELRNEIEKMKQEIKVV